MAVDDDETDLMRPSDAAAGGDEPAAGDTEAGGGSDDSVFTNPTPSDVQLAAEETLDAPSFPAMAADQGAALPREFHLQPGDTIDDFEVVKTLGRGAFGVVYLARQVSLDRRVALKLTENRGSEGRTMARLEHAHIVQVFSESVDDSGGFRLLCMQLVAGASLEDVIRALRDTACRDGAWAGADYLAAVDARVNIRESFDPSALRDRELLENATDVEAAAWVGARLAEAVNFAHANGVLHRDIKPANVLVNQYGRPMLADFNIAFRAALPPSGEPSPPRSEGDQSPGDDQSATFGGTLAFMAPEHLDAFNPYGDATPADVDERSDIYSLGIVVHELLSGRPPFQDPRRQGSRTRYVGLLAKWRREAPAPIEFGPPSARKVLQHTIAKALAPEKADRYQTGEQLAAALDGCRRLAAFERTAPRAASFTRAITRRPLLWAMLLIFLPQVVGSVVNIAYNRTQIMGALTAPQRDVFDTMWKTYNLIVYPAALATLVYFFLPVFRMWRALEQSDRLDGEQVDQIRRATLRLPIWVLIAAAVGWLPGGFLFPAAIAAVEGPISSEVFWHFVTSFTFSGLIAVAYSFCSMQYIAMRVLYPRFWTDATDFEATARCELAGTSWRVWFMLIASYVVPFVANVLFALLATQSDGSIPLAVLVFSVAVLGLFGTGITFVAAQAMTTTQVALTGRG